MTEKQKVIVVGYNEEIGWFINAECFNIKLDSLPDWRCEHIVRTLLKLIGEMYQ